MASGIGQHTAENDNHLPQVEFELPHLNFVPLDEIQNRLQRLQNLLVTKGIDGLLLLKDVNIFYFTGTAQRCYLFVPTAGNPVLMAQKSYKRALLESPLRPIIKVNNISELPSIIQEHGYQMDRLGLELHDIPANWYLNYQKVFPGSTLVDASKLVRQVRMYKSPWEVERIRRASQAIRLVVEGAKTILREGITEIEASVQMYEIVRVHGEQGRIITSGFGRYVLPMHVVAGASGGIPSFFEGLTGGEGATPLVPIGPSNKLIERNEPIYIDLGIAADGYIADVTRMFCVGRVPENLERAYRIAEEIENMIAEKMRPGVLAEELYHVGREYAKQNDLEEYFQGYREDQVLFVGHGIGLELDELPVLGAKDKTPLEPGMVLAVEPTFVFPGQGALGIEDSFLVTEKGCELLTPLEKGIIPCG